MEWQQFTGPVMAKGVEDTALYHYDPLVALNEVGGHPELPRGDVTTPGEEASLRSTASTSRGGSCGPGRSMPHRPTIRSEAKTSAAASRCWPTCLLFGVRHWNAGISWRRPAGVEDIDRKTEVLLFQTLLGAWPMEDIGHAKNGAGKGSDSSGEPVPEHFAQRIDAYMQKAVREANERTSWHRPDTEYEQSLYRVIHRLLRAEEGARFGPTCGEGCAPSRQQGLSCPLRS